VSFILTQKERKKEGEKAVKLMGYFRRRNRFRSRTSGGGNWVGYFQLRRNSILFLGLFLVGLLFSSVYTVRDSGGPQLILAVVTNHIQKQAVSSYGQLLIGRLGSSLGFIVFLYFAANCVQGRWLACLVPVFYGLSVGATVTAILFQHGLGAAGYLLACVLVPRFLQLILLMTACNQAIKLSQGISAKAPVGEQRFLLLGAAAALLSVVETVLISRFTGLLTYL